MFRHIMRRPPSNTVEDLADAIIEMRYGFDLQMDAKHVHDRQAAGTSFEQALEAVHRDNIEDALLGGIDEIESSVPNENSEQRETLRQVAEEYARLRSMTLSVLREIYNSERTKEKISEEQRSRTQRDAALECNLPSNEPDWEKWNALPFLEIHEASALAIRKDPNLLRQDVIYENDDLPTVKEYRWQRKIISRALKEGELGDRGVLTPASLWKWLASRNAAVYVDIKDSLDNIYDIEETYCSNSDEIFGATDRDGAAYEKLKKSLEGQSDEEKIKKLLRHVKHTNSSKKQIVNNILCILGASYKMYSNDFKYKSLREAAGKLESYLQEHSVNPIRQETILKYLMEAHRLKEDLGS